MTPEEFAQLVNQRLLDFYGYPEWRNPLPPLDELVSTVLSQNTNDNNRDVAFERLRQHAHCVRGQLGDRQSATDADAGCGPI